MATSSFSSILYGAIVSQLVDDLESVSAANAKLDELGYGLGEALLDIYMAENSSRCKTFEEMKEGCVNALHQFYEQLEPRERPDFELFPGDATQFSIRFKQNTLETNVKIPQRYRGLVYSEMIAGAFRGAFRLLEIDMEVEFVGSELRFTRLHDIKEELVKEE